MLITLQRTKKQIIMVLTFLENLKDRRRTQGQRYELKFIVLFSIMAFLSNAKSYRDISRFISGHYKVLKRYFSLSWKKPPGHTTIRNILLGIDSKELEACFREYTQSILDKVVSGEVASIAFDGKTLRGSYDNMQDKNALQMVFMFRTDNKLILAHEPIDQKTNEIPSIQNLLKEIQLEDYYYTMDALHCQKKLLK